MPVPEEIVSSKIDARMNNGILVVKLPKKDDPTKSKEEATKVEVKQMTRMRMSHNYNEVKEFNSETFCTKCGMSTPCARVCVCEWCWVCYVCHKSELAKKRF